jgi:large subunit ribosomal protein L32
MAVPKKKTSKSKRNMRRSHSALKKINVVIDKESGEFKLPHHICNGKYRKMQIIDIKEKKEEGSHPE